MSGWGCVGLRIVSRGAFPAMDKFVRVVEREVMSTMGHWSVSAPAFDVSQGVDGNCQVRNAAEAASRSAE